MNDKLLSIILLSMMLFACKSTPIAESKPMVADSKKSSVAHKQASTATERHLDTRPAPSSEVMANSGDHADGSNTMMTEDKTISPLKDNNNILSKRIIYFDFDSDAIKAEFRPLIEAHAKYLLANKTVKITLQGNTDAHGTREYNLALGQRRSVAVKKALNLLGVVDTQIETVSFGEEKANNNCKEKDDACFAANRHADIVYDGE